MCTYNVITSSSQLALVQYAKSKRINANFIPVNSKEFDSLKQQGEIEIFDLFILPDDSSTIGDASELIRMIHSFLRGYLAFKEIEDIVYDEDKMSKDFIRYNPSLKKYELFTTLPDFDDYFTVDIFREEYDNMDDLLSMIDDTYEYSKVEVKETVSEETISARLTYKPKYR